MPFTEQEREALIASINEACRMMGETITIPSPPPIFASQVELPIEPTQYFQMPRRDVNGLICLTIASCSVGERIFLLDELIRYGFQWHSDIETFPDGVTIEEHYPFREYPVIELGKDWQNKWSICGTGGSHAHISASFFIHNYLKSRIESEDNFIEIQPKIIGMMREAKYA